MSQRLIDADALTDKVDKYIYRITRASKRKLKVGESAILADIKAHIELSPTIDAVPVIRCKDCKFYEVAELNYDGTPDKRFKPSICANGWYEYAVERDPNWFCADAEPKETE